MKNKIMELADDLARAAFNDQMRQEEARAALQAEVARVEQELADARLGAHVRGIAVAHKWSDSEPEDALTYLLRKCREVAIEDCKNLNRAELEAAKADVERMKHLVANVRCADANIDGQHTWNFLWGKGWTTGASFREAVDNAKKGQTE